MTRWHRDEAESSSYATQQRTPRVMTREAGGGKGGAAVLILLSTNAEMKRWIVWQGTGSTSTWNLSCYNPRVQAALFGFRLLVCEGGCSTAAAVTLDTVADESRKIADGVTRSPSRRCSRDGKISCYGDGLRTIFLLLCLLPAFLFFLIISCIPECSSSPCSFVCGAAIYYSQQVRTL